MTSDPGAGADVRRGSTVALDGVQGPRAVSRARPGRQQPLAEAQRQLTAANGCGSGQVTEAYDETVPAGQVISTDPEAGQPR